MSGPIVRKYGFPNFEKIFGERPLEHGVEDDAKASEVQAGELSTAQSTKPTTVKAKDSGTKDKA